MIEQGRITADQIQLISAIEPRFLSMKILPTAMKRQAAERLKEHIRWLRRQPPYNTPAGFKRNADTFMQWLTCLTQVHEDDWSGLIPEFVSYTDKLDALRGEDCLSVFPELSPLFGTDDRQDGIAAGKAVVNK
ncbi:MAG TPA: hypothetical protein ENN69_00815 [Spirochaetia bacterium]|nr:hypothetical protein [Spirochaetia bacterium]